MSGANYDGLGQHVGHKLALKCMVEGGVEPAFVKSERYAYWLALHCSDCNEWLVDIAEDGHGDPEFQ